MHNYVAPVRERGLKCSPLLERLWPFGVAPVRERGLKYNDTRHSALDSRRSRKGAWIEIATSITINSLRQGRSRKGAWIEIHLANRLFNDSYSRSRKGAWIEMQALGVDIRL